MHRILFLYIVLLTALPLGAEERTVPESASEITLSFAPVVKAAAPAVVNIYAERVVAERISPFAGDPFFSQFFGGVGRAVPRVENSLGSGVIVSAEGYVVSNHHVVEGARDIRVVLSDGREFAGVVVLDDAVADLAVIRLDTTEDLPFITIGEPERLQVGDLVLAIGNPFGVGQTVSSGIVSALARPGAPGQPGYFIQTDAPINPGNSGGALVDMRGRLIGINTSILTRSGGSNGIGFAIPADLVRVYVEQAKAGREAILRPWSGVEVQAVDAHVAEALGLERPEGVIIADIHPQSPFALAGLQKGDVILRLGGRAVNSGQELDHHLTIAGAGMEGEVDYLGAEGPGQVVLTLVPAPDDPPADPRRVAGRMPLAGLDVATVNPALIDRFDLPLSAHGAVVLGGSGPALRSGLRPGDIIRSVNGRAIASSADLAGLGRLTSRLWVVEFERDGRGFELRLGG